MDEQLTFFEESTFSEPVFIEKFDTTEVDNEKEEDIEDLQQLDLSGMAVTGTDWTTETIITQIKKNNIILNPDFQRRDAWNKRTKSKFIESLFLGLPIPQIILAEQRGKKGKFLVIDGKQRLLSLQQFVINENENPLRLVGLDVKTEFNKKTYKDILEGSSNDEIDAFNNQPIRTVVVKNWPSVQALYLLFLRLNTGSVKLSPQELRQALYPGSFIKYANKASAENLELKRMLKLKNVDFRMRDVEIFIRYYAFKYFSDKYSGSMQAFLDMTCDTLNKDWELKQDCVFSDNESLKKAIDLTFSIFGEDDAFRKYKGDKYEEKFNRAVIDIMLYYFSKGEIRERVSEVHYLNIKTAYENLCKGDREFLASIETTTKSLSSVQNRFYKWGETLKTVLDTNITLPRFM